MTACFKSCCWHGLRPSTKGLQIVDTHASGNCIDTDTNTLTKKYKEEMLHQHKRLSKVRCFGA